MQLMMEKNGYYLADTARVAGDVRIGKGTNIWFGVSIRGDDATITLGEDVNVQDNVVIHADLGRPLVIAGGVGIGHGAIVHGLEVGENTLIGMGAIVLGGTRIGRDCVIAAGAVVLEGAEIPDRSVVMGVPGKLRRQASAGEIEMSRWRAAAYREKAQRWCRGEYASVV